MRIASIIGTRPQVIKAAALEPVLHSDLLIDTGQHSDWELCGALFSELGLRVPDITLGGSTGIMLDALTRLLRDEKPDVVLVYGDTDSTLAGALAGARLGIPVAHVEAGLRSFDRQMPEEVNRIVADHLATWCFAPTDTALGNLSSEGITGIRTGDLMQDLAADTVPWLKSSTRPQNAPYALATIHRAANRTPAAIAAWTAILGDIPMSVLLPLHPGTAKVVGTLPDNVTVLPPQGYRESLRLQLHAAAVLTDSGGVQREASWLGVPCLLLRDTTEWPDANSFLVGLDRDLAVRMFAAVADTTMRAGPLDIPHSGTASVIAAVLR